MIVDVMIMDAAKAQYFRDATANQVAKLDPRLIDLGDYAGMYLLSVRLKTAPEFEEFWPEFDELAVVTVDTDLIFAPPPDD